MVNFSRMQKKSKHVLVMMQPMSDLRFAGIARFAQSHGWFLTVEERFAHGAMQGEGATLQVQGPGVSFWWPLSLQSIGPRHAGSGAAARGLSKCSTLA